MTNQPNQPNQPKRPIWPYMILLVLLFVLAATAPRSWQHVIRKTERSDGSTRRTESPAVDRPAHRESLEIDLAESATAASETHPGPNDAARVAPEARETVSAIDLPVTDAETPGSPVDVAIGDLEVSTPLPDDRTRDEENVVGDLQAESESTARTGNQDAVPDVLFQTSAPRRKTAPEEPFSGEKPAELADDVDPGADDEEESSFAAVASDPFIMLLEPLTTEPVTRVWANGVMGLAAEDVQSLRDDPHRLDQFVARLRGALYEADRLIPLVQPGPNAVRLRRAHHALLRRLGVWELVFESRQARSTDRQREIDPSRLVPPLARVDALIDDSAEKDGWTRYLMLGTLRDVAQQPSPTDRAQCRLVARQVLKRLEYAPLSTTQQHFVSSGPVAELAAELRYLAAEPASLETLLEELAAYEHTGLTSHGAEAARQRQLLVWSPDGDLRELARRVELHYRNCNIRVALHSELLERVLPEPQTLEGPVRDVVGGVPVRGRSRTTTNLGVRLFPDQEHLRWAIQVHGETTSWTSSKSGPASFRHQGMARFTTEQPMQLGITGIRTETPYTFVEANPRLAELETDFDSIPLLGWIIRSEAQRRHDERRGQSVQHMEAKVARQAEAHVSATTRERVTAVNAKIEERLLVPLGRMSLEPTAVDYETTDDRLVMRVRLAADQQLGAHTPRPQAPADSMLSAQVHESAINNVLERLELAGRTFGAPELYDWIRYKLNLTEPDDNPPRDDVWLALAARDPIRIRCQKGRVMIHLDVDWLQKGTRRWRNFEVRVAYRPDPNSNRAELVRDGTIQLIGDRLGGRGQIALRSAFSRMFSAERRWQLLPDEWASDPRLADLELTQFIIDDGWIGIAVGPTRQNNSTILSTDRRGHIRR